MLNLGIAVNYAEAILNTSYLKPESTYNYFSDLVSVLNKAPLLVDFLEIYYISKNKKKTIFFYTIWDYGELKPIFDFIFDNNKAEYLKLISECLLRLYRQKFKIGDLLIIASIEPNDTEIKDISKFIKEKFNFNDVLTRIEIDKEIISGFKIYINNMVLDLSIQGLLKDIESKLLLK